MENKTCVKCNQSKSIDSFYVTKGKTDYYCKTCRVGSALKSQRNNSKSCSEDGCMLGHYAKDLCRVHYARLVRTGDTRLKIKQKAVYANGTTYVGARKAMLKRKYNLTVESYNERAANGCEICGISSENRTFPLHIDHYHGHCPSNSGCPLCMRGILCDKCNTAVGMYENKNLRDDYPMRDKIIIYVSKYSQIIADRMETHEQDEQRG